MEKDVFIILDDHKLTYYEEKKEGFEFIGCINFDLYKCQIQIEYKQGTPRLSISLNQSEQVFTFTIQWGVFDFMQ